MKFFTAFALIFFCCSLFSQVAFSQDSPSLRDGVSSIDSDLQQLENLIQDTLANTEEQQKLLEDLRQNLNESGNLIENYESIMQEQEQEQLLSDFYANSDTGNGVN